MATSAMAAGPASAYPATAAAATALSLRWQSRRQPPGARGSPARVAQSLRSLGARSSRRQPLAGEVGGELAQGVLGGGVGWPVSSCRENRAS